MIRSARTILFALSLAISTFASTQNAPFNIGIEPLNIAGLSGIQSFAFAQDSGKWLIVGGRLDGLHQRQPWASFDVAGHNNQLIVVDPLTQQKWTAPITSLPAAIQEQLRSTNMEFYQEGDYLYCLGGYGYSNISADHTTFPNLTAISVSDVINGVINSTPIASYFRQITDPKFQVTGGRLKKIDSTFYLLGGQKFIGRYNPMGPNNGPGFIQQYTNAITKFDLTDNGTTITIAHLPSYTDSVNLHRRDYNAESEILPNGAQGITMFSGVFQQNANLPFLNSVSVQSSGYFTNNAFQQYYNHYHCPVLPIYSGTNKEMHTVFFGGIAQYYDSLGVLVQDNNVPFVNTIARVTKDSTGAMAEYKLPIEMPALLGAGGEFIPNLNFPHYSNDVFQLDSLQTDSVLIGYIFGGISSTAANIFFLNNGTQSNASSQVFKVFLKRALPLSIDELNYSSTNSLNLLAYPNPSEGELNLTFTLKNKDNVRISIADAKGSMLLNTVLKNLNAGTNEYKTTLNNFSKGAIFFVTLETTNEKVTRKLILRK
jgi:hypothetical protein